MAEPATLQTDRLVLRPFEPGDAPAVQRILGERAMSDSLINIPHPFSEEMAAGRIDRHIAMCRAGRMAEFAIVLPASGELIGSTGLNIHRWRRRAELFYWIARPHWGRGYATEAAATVVSYGFTELALKRIYAQHFVANPASGRVLCKIGLRYRRRVRRHVAKWDRSELRAVYVITRRQFLAQARRPDTVDSEEIARSSEAS